ncbi:MAG TPA: prephenate dehydratase domain-containing protein, partial [Methylocystis sp.]|nr:prephenate dehydratase domain-containing protein [Methylocystis sp.]
MSNKIAFQGEPGANSDIACREAYPHLTPLPCASFEDAFTAVTNGEATLAMIPIENSIAGRVADIHHFLPGAGLYIIGEYFLPIHFQLLGLEGSKLADITSVYSHVHALGQCRKIIRKYDLKAVVTGDTAGSAREVAEWGDRTRASLAPLLAADIYGLDVL